MRHMTDEELAAYYWRITLEGAETGYKRAVAGVPLWRRLIARTVAWALCKSCRDAPKGASRAYPSGAFSDAGVWLHLHPEPGATICNASHRAWNRWARKPPSSAPQKDTGKEGAR